MIWLLMRRRLNGVVCEVYLNDVSSRMKSVFSVGFMVGSLVVRVFVCGIL